MAATLMTLAAAPLAAQGMSGMAGMDHSQTAQTPLSAKAKADIAEAKRVAQAYDTPEKARAAGYSPRFGDVPLQGEHWVNSALVLSGKFDLEHPPILMFTTVNGVKTLTGSAYAYEVQQDSGAPAAFDGAAQWHEHLLLSLPGKRLVMTHVWFVPSPGGPFAHDNPTLAFTERNLPQPPAGWLDTSTYRGLALALSLGNWQIQQPGRGRRGMGLVQNDSALATLTAERDSMSAMVPLLASAETKRDAKAYHAEAADVIALGNRLLSTVKDVPQDPMVRLFWGQLIEEALGDHHVAGHTSSP
ncbi:MAG TPA: hypothetical protein VHW65_00230 [Gemmatimonadales bacterium]|jgi:hypothetical protein|nr:hypothetical protein [Gemmatimonadales bacterium]